MDLTTVLTYLKDLLATVMTLLMMMSPAFGGNGVAYEAENPDQLIMSMAVVSDIHVETNQPKSYDNLSKVLEGIKAGKDIDAVGYLGDNVMNGQFLENVFFYNAVKAVNPAKENIVAIGNHDLGNGEGDYSKSYNDFLANNGLYLGNKIDKTYYYKIINGCYVIVLASEDEAAQEFHMSDAQFAWLEGVLKEAEAADAPIIVMNHFPIYYLKGPDGNGNTRDSRQLALLLNKYNNVLFLHGHIHDDFDSGNFYEWWGVNCINFCRVTEITEYEAGDGVVVEVYEDEILVRGRNFITGQWNEGLEYRYAFDK